MRRLVETADGKGAWLRAWPSGHVHYSADWCSRLDGKMDTACGRLRMYWPTVDWPKAKICDACRSSSPEGAAVLAEDLSARC